jgi:16S rRNA C967 or C1407 C5-methylase (RsmB/RsmF family)
MFKYRYMLTKRQRAKNTFDVVKVLVDNRTLEPIKVIETLETSLSYEEAKDILKSLNTKLRQINRVRRYKLRQEEHLRYLNEKGVILVFILAIYTWFEKRFEKRHRVDTLAY